MCGIIGIVGGQNAPEQLIEGLRRLEYRGYDSAGIATLSDGQIQRRRAKGKLHNLEHVIHNEPINGTTGIGHTRWATHGRPSKINAHPHATEKVAIVHNGIIENYQKLRQELEAKNHIFQSQTDSEVISHLITEFLTQGHTPQEAITRSLERLEGAFAMAALFADHEHLVIAARHGAPLVVGHGRNDSLYLASDTLALAPITEYITYLEEGDQAILQPGNLIIHDSSQTKTSRSIHHIAAIATASKGDFAHYMLKEIHEQPTAIGDTLASFIDPRTRSLILPAMDCDWCHVPKINLVACGTSYYATLTARYWFEHIAGLAAQCDTASEFRYRDPALPENGVAIFVSQSGETADTLAALRHAKAAGQYSIAIVNIPNSAMAREADYVLTTHGGPEISVASTKAFTTQLAILATMAIAIGRERGNIDAKTQTALSRALIELPGWINETLRQDDQLSHIASRLARANHVLYMGRGTNYPIALEGALKLKEISYIHAEGYAAGEMKHGPIALIEANIPVIFIMPSDPLFAKTLSNLEEVAARGGDIIAVSDSEGIAKIGSLAAHTITLPQTDPLVAPLIYAVGVQLLAYRTAVAKGTDVDQPRNLAKSVTVE